MDEALPQWVAEAAALPVAFAQVREDPRIDRCIVERAGASARICMIASGGCTAAVLATVPNVAAIHIVDPNAAQLALARWKVRLLETADTPQRLAQLGHTDPPEAPQDRTGPDFLGRYERCFAELQRELQPVRSELQAALSLTEPAEQARRVAPDTPLGRRLDSALDAVLRLPNLVALFGEGATRNPVEPFARHFAKRIRYFVEQGLELGAYIFDRLYRDLYAACSSRTQQYHSGPQDTLVDRCSNAADLI